MCAAQACKSEDPLCEPYHLFLSRQTHCSARARKAGSCGNSRTETGSVICTMDHSSCKLGRTSRCAAYVREGSYNTLLPATTSSEEEEGEEQSSGDDSLRRGGKAHGSSKSPKKKRGPRKKDDDEVST